MQSKEFIVSDDYKKYSPRHYRVECYKEGNEQPLRVFIIPTYKMWEYMKQLCTDFDYIILEFQK